MIKKGIFLAGTNGAINILMLGRSIILARLLGIEDFAVAVSFVIIGGFFELLSNFAVEMYVVQSKDGDSERVQASGHVFQIARGCLTALLILLSAPLIADYFGRPDATDYYRLLAGIPIIKGFYHLDVVRFQRQHEFGPFVRRDLFAAIASLMVAALGGILLESYAAMVLALYAQVLAGWAVTFREASRPYRTMINKDVMLSILRFGWPLLVNALFLFMIMEGEKVIIGGEIGMREMGWFAVAASITLAPSLVLARTVQSYFLPIVSRFKDTDSFDDAVNVMQFVSIFTNIFYVFSMFVFGSALVVIVYGAEYIEALQVVSLMVLVQGVRIAKSNLSIIAVAIGRTRYPMYANIPRIILLLYVWWQATYGISIQDILYVALAGEVLGVVISTTLIYTHSELSFLRLAAKFIVLAAILLMVIADMQGWSLVFAPIPFEILGGPMALSESAVMMALLSFGYCLAGWSNIKDLRSRFNMARP